MNGSNSFLLLPFSLPKFTKNRSRVVPFKNSVDFFSSQNLELLFPNVEKVLLKPILALSNQSHFKVVFTSFDKLFSFLGLEYPVKDKPRRKVLTRPRMLPLIDPVRSNLCRF